ncbi:MAG: HAD-IIB family hydrolase [Pseudomonadota bacterium]
MKLLENSESCLSKIKYIFADIDDTITHEGKLIKESFNALWKAFDAGIKVIPVTGRPAGWVDHIARMWPVFAVIGENGAFYFYMKNGKLNKKYFFSKEETINAKAKLKAIENEVLLEVPNAIVSSDQAYREFDLAIDFCEDIDPLSKEEINKIVEIFTKHGAISKISSIHVNGWFGAYDKATMIDKFSKEMLNKSFEEINNNSIFIGDSPNDEPMFKKFNNSIGVANISNFQDQISNLPKFITTKPGGLGFAETIDIILNFEF